MGLRDEIARFKESRPVSPEVAETMKRGRDSIRASGATGLSVGDRAPDFSLPNQAGKTVRLADRLAAGPVVLSFYRGEW